MLWSLPCSWTAFLSPTSDAQNFGHLLVKLNHQRIYRNAPKCDLRLTVHAQQLSLHDEVQFLRAENADLRRQLADRDAQIAERDARIAALEAENAALKARVVELEALVAKLSKIVFGKSSEKRSEKMSRPNKEIEKQD